MLREPIPQFSDTAGASVDFATYFDDHIVNIAQNSDL